MKRVLVISGVQVWPPESGGQWRTAALCEALAARGCEVRVHSLTGRKRDYLAGARSGEYRRGERLTEFVDRSWAQAALQLATYRAGWPDLWHLVFPPASRRLRRSIADAEVVIADFPFLARYLALAQGRRRVLNAHNLEHERWSGRRGDWVERAEARAAKNAELVLAPSEHEAAFYRARGADVLLVPNAIAPDRFAGPVDTAALRRELGLAAGTRILLFAGSRYQPNRIAYRTLRPFAARLAASGACLLVVGSVAEPHREPGLVATGPVERIEPYFALAEWGLNPVTTGSGTNLKMAEYLVAKLPILSTDFGARGFTLTKGEDYLGCDEEGIRQALQLSPDERRRMAEQALAKNRDRVDMTAVVEATLHGWLKNP